MPGFKIRRALISAYDKTGIVDFARTLATEFGVEIISTGGTARLLKGNNIPVTLVEQITGFPEMLDGRVKTLHPKIHAAILADRDNPDHMRQIREQGIEPIDLVVVSLYPFEKTIADPHCTHEQAIEMIDIGGPCLLRAAAKNHRHVLVVVSPEDYGPILQFLRNPKSQREDELRSRLMTAVFQATSAYDTAIRRHFAAGCDDTSFPESLMLQWTRATDPQNPQLRYGENPHQRASVYRDSGPLRGLWSKGSVVSSNDTMSFNNYADAGAAIALCKEITRAFPGMASALFIKHTNCCGCAMDKNPLEAYRMAYGGDANAAMGGILACNFEVTARVAEAVMQTFDRWGRERRAAGFFVEVWIAPSFLPDAAKVIQTLKPWGQRVRTLSLGEMAGESEKVDLDYRCIPGGILVQTQDDLGLNEEDWRFPTDRKATQRELSDLRLAWLICKHTKSNAITLCKDGMLLGNGAGQMSRIMSCRIATWLAKENGHAESMTGSSAASDAFFPFPDGPAILLDAGVTAIIQPGGGKRDEETIALCNQRNAAMILTGTRHFRH